MSLRCGSVSLGKHPWMSSLATRFILSFMLGGLLAVSTGCGPSSSHSTQSAQAPTATSVPPPTVWDTLMGQIGPDGHWDVATSLQAFALAFGPLPGVTVPSGTPGELPSADMVLDDIFYHWPALSSAQQQAVTTILQTLALPSIHAMHIMAAAYSPPIPAKAGSGVAITAGQCAAAAVTALPNLPDGPTYVDVVTQAIADICANLHRSLPTNMPVTLSNLTPAFLQQEKKPVTWDAATLCSNGLPISCEIIINLAQWQKFGYSAARQQYVLAHESFHLFQRTYFPTSAQEHTRGKWLLEGEADWVADVLAPSDPYTGDWAWWFGVNPNGSAIPLFERSYSAVGFYEDLAEVTSQQTVWGVLDKMLGASGNVASYQIAVSVGGQPFLYSLASIQARNRSYGPNWDLTAPYVPMFPPFTTQPLTLAAGDQQPVTVQAYTSLLDQVSTSADVILIAIPGYARLHDQGQVDTNQSGLTDSYFCVKQGGCTCPAGTANAGVSLQQATGVLDVAVWGDTQGTNGTMQGFSLDTFCQTTIISPKDVLARFAAAPWTDMIGTVTVNGKLDIGKVQYLNTTPVTVLATDINPGGDNGGVEKVYVKGDTYCVFLAQLGNWTCSTSSALGGTYNFKSGWSELKGLIFGSPKNQTINGLMTIHIQGQNSVGGVTQLWFRQDNYFLVREVVTSSGGVNEYDFNQWNTGSLIFPAPSS
jgi:hypothetical protein